ncbi:MAG: GNAT family N-acetyltransferase [Acholeplasmatales bacterium]|nr:GNAT family N-acetyltransferase [Acholeplasmatales bacterium]
MIREIKKEELCQLLELYKNLNNNTMPIINDRILSLWDNILSNNNYHIIVAVIDGKVVSSCTCIIIPNLTHNQRPYAFIENVVTDSNYRNKGLATACLDYAKEIAISSNCYKIMLMTGSKKESTLNFYRNAGYNSEDKTGFIMHLE